MTWKTYTANHVGYFYITPSIVGTVGGSFNKKMIDVAFHWITFGFGLNIEWGRKDG